jgi:hypothetical protein
LQANQRILVQPSALVWKDQSVSMFLHFEYASTASWGGSFFSAYDPKTVWLALQGPGRVAIKSVFERPEPLGPVYQASPHTRAAW